MNGYLKVGSHSDVESLRILLAASATDTSWTLADLQYFARFQALFVVSHTLGKGSDGEVWAYKLRTASAARFIAAEWIAVKFPTDSSASAINSIHIEIRNLATVGHYEHFCGMLASCIIAPTVGPIIYLPYCDLGDLFTYRKNVLAQVVRNGRRARVPERTILKLFRDMSLALDHLHNKLGWTYVHQDLKPENILVVTPPGWRLDDGMPLEPIFKITDFNRMKVSGSIQPEWQGTYAYSIDPS
jgi:serine/threonine protein kinase